MGKSFLYALVFLAASGCQSNVIDAVAYPEIWPEYLRRDVCTPIDGLYAYEGWKYSGEESIEIMAEMGVAIGGYIIDGTPWFVEISAGDDSVSHVFNIYGDRLSFVSEQKSRYKYVSESYIVIEKKFHCSGGKYIEEYKYDSAAEGMAHKGRVVYSYLKDIEGSLIIGVAYTNVSSGSLFILGKKATSGNVWYKFVSNENEGVGDK